jgi:hypothetical protein
LDDACAAEILNCWDALAALIAPPHCDLLRRQMHDWAPSSTEGENTQKKEEKKFAGC